ncbi:hypothetical protein V1477_000703 [Vespula maculifrons]|uniref:Uncharacterized protein n=1 Tax=Vespula maculifrons TaxID=7453 RepID=A0ABD2D2C8_VESMC
MVSLAENGANFPCRRLSMIPERDISLTEQSPFDFSRMDGTRSGSFAVEALPYDDGSNHEATDAARGKRKFRRSVFKSDFVLAPANSLRSSAETANAKTEETPECPLGEINDTTRRRRGTRSTSTDGSRALTERDCDSLEPGGGCVDQPGTTSLWPPPDTRVTSRSEPFFPKIPKGFGKIGREVIKMRYVSGDLLKRPAFENSFDSLAEQRRERLNGNEAMAGKQTDG